MRLGTIIAIIIALAGCGLAGTQMIRADRLEEDLARAQQAMEQAEKSAKFERGYPTPAYPRMRPPPATSEPKGGSASAGLPSTVERQSPPAKQPADAVVQQLFSAALAFVIPEAANIEDEIKAQLLINPAKEVEALTRDLTKKGTVIGGNVKVSRVVKATIVAPDFEVTNITEEEQILTDTESTEWLWALTPKTAGSHDVSLTVTAIVTVNNRETKHHLKTFEKTVTVEVTTQQVILGWFKRNWQWIVSTLIIPFGIWLYKKWLARD